MEEWKRRNPLRIWRETRPPEGWTRALMSRQVKVSRMMVALWEDGACVPSPASMAKIKALTGITARVWDAWVRNKPKD